MATSYPTLLAEIERFRQQTQNARYLVALSGGLDSTVLLHLLAQDKASQNRTQALYVDHQIQAQSAQWGLHCQTLCKAWSVDFQCVKVKLEATKRQGLEARARKARYHALHQALNSNTLLLTAHHQRDQAETFLLNLARGSGVAGLAAMPYQKPIQLEGSEQTWHVRPLLNVPYKELEHYAKHHHLNWVEDPSNLDNRFMRNHIRNRLLPEYEQACPVIQQQIERAVNHQSEALNLLDRLAYQDLIEGEYNDHAIKLSSYVQLDWASLKNVLRYWAKRAFGLALNYDQLEWVKRYGLDETASSASLKLQTGSLRLYRGSLYYVIDKTHDYRFNLKEFSENIKSDWGQGRGWLEASKAKVFTLVLPVDWVNKHQAQLSIGNLASLNSHKPVVNRKTKKWFQEQSIPSWQRPFWPVLFLDETPLFLCGGSINKARLSEDLTENLQPLLSAQDSNAEQIQYTFSERDVIRFFQG